MNRASKCSSTQLLQLDNYIKKISEAKYLGECIDIEETYIKGLKNRLEQDLFQPLMSDALIDMLSTKIKEVSNLNNFILNLALNLYEDFSLLCSKFEEDIDFSEVLKGVRKFEALMDLFRMVKEGIYNRYFSYGLNKPSDTSCSKDTNPLVSAICSIKPTFAVTFILDYNEKKYLRGIMDNFWRIVYDNILLNLSDFQVYYTIEEGNPTQVHCAVQLYDDIPGNDEIVERREEELKLQNYFEYLFKNRYEPDGRVFLSKIQNPVAWAEYMTKGVKDASELYLIKPQY